MRAGGQHADFARRSAGHAPTHRWPSPKRGGLLCRTRSGPSCHPGAILGSNNVFAPDDVIRPLLPIYLRRIELCRSIFKSSRCRQIASHQMLISRRFDVGENSPANRRQNSRQSREIKSNARDDRELADNSSKRCDDRGSQREGKFDSSQSCGDRLIVPSTGSVKILYLADHA